MDLSKNNYRKFLVDEVTRASNVEASAAYREVCEFSKTKRFDDSYQKWVLLNREKGFRPKSMKEIIEGMD